MGENTYSKIDIQFKTTQQDGCKKQVAICWKDTKLHESSDTVDWVIEENLFGSWMELEGKAIRTAQILESWAGGSYITSNGNEHWVYIGQNSKITQVNPKKETNEPGKVLSQV